MLLTRALLLSLCVLGASARGQAAFEQESFELDLSVPLDALSTAVVPSLSKPAPVKQGAFVGLEAKKPKEKFDTATHKLVVDALSQELGGKVIPAESTLGALSKANLMPGAARSQAALAKLARSLNVAWVVILQSAPAGALEAALVDFEGRARGSKHSVGLAERTAAQQAHELARLTAKEIREQKVVLAAEAAKATVAPPPPLEDSDAELAAIRAIPEVKAPPPPVTKAGPIAVPSTPRLSVAVGPGVVLRSLSLDGQAADALAELKNDGAPGLGVYAQLNPLQFFGKTKGQRWSDLEVEFHYRHGFVQATVESGPGQGDVCTMVDDDLQVKGTWRYKFSDSAWMPSVGVSGGWSQEQTVFSCSLPLLSTRYRGADVQLRIRQPLYREFVALDLAGGPRFLFQNQNQSSSSQADMSLAGEAWIEARPISILFARGGARVSRLQVTTDGLGAVDVRAFLAVEVGGYF